MKKNNEITALKACGVSVIKMSMPVLIASLGLSFVVFFFSELVVPYASGKSNDIWHGEVKKRSGARFYNRTNIWYRSKQAIYWIFYFDEKRLEMHSPSFYFFDASFHLVKRIDAKSATWVKDKWKVENGIIQQLRDDNTFTFEKFKEIDLILPEDPESFLKTDKLPEEMSYWELGRHAEKTAHGGYDDTRFLVDQNFKLAFPLLSFIMVLVGIPTALILKKGGAPLAVSLGITACFLYMIIQGLTLALGYACILPPVLSAWFANFVFLFLGSYLMIRVET